MGSRSLKHYEVRSEVRKLDWRAIGRSVWNTNSPIGLKALDYEKLSMFKTF